MENRRKRQLEKCIENRRNLEPEDFLTDRRSVQPEDVIDNRTDEELSSSQIVSKPGSMFGKVATNISSSPTMQGGRESDDQCSQGQ